MKRDVLSAAAILVAGAAFNTTAQASTIYWNGSATGTWAAATNWTTSATDTSQAPAAAPGAADDVIFNQPGNTANASLTLGNSQSAASLTFNTTGGVSLTGSSASASALRIGSGGITMNAGSSAATSKFGVTLTADQTWTLNNTGGLAFTSSTGGIADATITAPITLTVAGTGTGGLGITPANVLRDNSATGTLALVIKNASGNVKITNSQSYTGGTTVLAGYLRPENISALGTGTVTLGDTTGSAAVTLAANLSGNVGNNIVVQAGNTGTITISNVGANAPVYTGTVGLNNAVIVNPNSGTITFSNTISGNGSLKQSGNGTLTLNGAASYTGGTTVTAGKLVVGSTLAGNVSATGGTLGGTGTIAGVVTAASATLAPGTTAAGTLTTGGLSMTANSILAYDLDPSVHTAGGTANDEIIVNGNLTLDGKINLNAATDLSAGTYTLIHYTGSLTDNGLLVGTNFATTNGQTYSISIDPTGQNVNLVVVPEPAMLGAVAIGTLGLLSRRRRMI